MAEIVSQLEDEIKVLKEQNNELVQKVQFWKIKSAQNENDKLDLMKENNELRLNLSRLRSGGAAQARALDTALQSTSEQALSYLVQASTAVTRTIELAKSYMRERTDLEAMSPRWSAISGSPGTSDREKVHKVAPMIMGGRSIQPYVSLNRMPLNNSVTTRTPNQNRNAGAVLPLPMHVLQDVYIPLQRIDPSEYMNVHEDNGNNMELDQDELLEEDNGELVVDQHRISEEVDLEETRQLDIVHEDSEPEGDMSTPTPTRRRSVSLDPLEGPSWLLDNSRRGRGRRRAEPDSTTEPPDPAASPATAPLSPVDTHEKENMPVSRLAFTPTVRRRRRTATPPPRATPAPPATPATSATPRNTLTPRNSSATSCERVLKVIVPKMCMLPPYPAAAASPRVPPAVPAAHSPAINSPSPAAAPPAAKRRACCEAPSPNGSTDHALTVQEHVTSRSASPEVSEIADHSSRSCASDGDGDRARSRTRRPRKKVTYTEVPLNRKMRR